MKIIKTAIAMLGLAPLGFAEDPTGTISVTEDIVRAGTFPRINWNIDFPASGGEGNESGGEDNVGEVVDIETPGTIVPRRDLVMQARVIAADVQRRTPVYVNQSRWYRSGGRWFFGTFRVFSHYEFEYLRVLAKGQINGGSEAVLYQDVQPNVDSIRVVWQREIKEGDAVTFSSRVDEGGFGYYHSGVGSDNVLVLKNGDVPPEYSTWETQATLGTHISAYLDEEGRVDIGPRDLIVAFELTHELDSTRSDNEGDLQDMILLLTFED